MDIKQLQYFIEVARLNSFTRAADHLFVTQPAISKMIKNLEEELGVVLFNRSRKKLTLTDAGRVLYEQAKIIDKAFHHLESELENISHLKKGHIRIGLPPLINSLFFSTIMGQFHKEYPGITFELVEDGSKKIEENIIDDKLDFGVIVLPTNQDLFDCHPFMKEELMLIVDSEHRLADKTEVPMAELEHENFVFFNKDFALRDRIVAACAKSGFKPSIISESSQWEFIEEMVASKLGVTLLPKSTCEYLDDRVKPVKVTEPSINWDLAIIWKKDYYISYVAKEFLQFTKDRISLKYENS